MRFWAIKFIFNFKIFVFFIVNLYCTSEIEQNDIKFFLIRLILKFSLSHPVVPRTKFFLYHWILENEKSPKINTFFGDFCARQAQVIPWFPITLGQRVFFYLIVDNEKTPKIDTVFGIFALGKHTSNPVDPYDTRTKFFIII